MSMAEVDEPHYEAPVEKFYENPEDELLRNGKFIDGLTHEDVSEYITKFPFIYQIYKKNTPEFQYRLIEGLMRAPTPSDGPGFIYGFMNQLENTLLEVPYWIKMGRTKREQPQKRIFEWEREEGIELTQIFTVRSLYNMKLEFLVHQLFAYARKERILNGKNRIEWFKFNEITLTAAAVNILNHIMNTIHTSAKLKTSQYCNKQLRIINGRLSFTNDHIDQLMKTIEPMENIGASISRDLGIQMGKHPEEKKKLEDAGSWEQILEITSPFSIGKELAELCRKIDETEEKANRCVENLQILKNGLVDNLKKINEKTKVVLIKEDIPITVRKTGKSPKRYSPSKRMQKIRKQERSYQIRNQQSSSSIINISNAKVHPPRDRSCEEITEVQFKARKNYDIFEKYVKKTNTNNKKGRDKSINVSKKFGKSFDGEKVEGFMKEYQESMPVKKNVKGHIAEMTVNSLTKVEEAANKENLQQIMVLSQEFEFNMNKIETNRLLVILAKKIRIQIPITFCRGEKKKQIYIFCRQIDNFSNVKIESSCEKNVSFYQVPDRDSIIALDDYHSLNLEIDAKINKFADKLRNMYI